MVRVWVHDVVQTPYGDAVVVEVDWARDMFTTEDLETGISVEWQASEVEELAPPADPNDVEAMDRWLRIKAMVVPSLNVETDTVRCSPKDCTCEHCYRIVKKVSARGMKSRYEITHHADNQVCRCNALDQSGPKLQDCACMGPVNVRWGPPR